MDKLKKLCWADSSEDSSSDTEVGTPLLDPYKQQILDSIVSSNSHIFEFKLENLPYSLISPSELYIVLNLQENEAEIRLQFKGQKFSGSAIVSVDNINTAVKVANKYNTVFYGRPISMFYKPEGSLQWVPQKKKNRKQVSALVSSTPLARFSMSNAKSKSFSKSSAFTPKQIRQNDPAIVSVVGSKGNKTHFRRFLFE